MSARESEHSTPASSPPPDDNKAAKSREDEQLDQQRRDEQAKRDEEMEEKRQEDLKGGKKHMDDKFKSLMYLLNQSKLWSSVMLQQMQQEDEAREEDDEGARDRAAKREEQAEEIAEESQRRATRTQPGKKRGRPAKQSGKISDYLSKKDVVAKAEAKEIEDDGVKTGDVGMQDLKSAKQPKLVTGGTMRKYQLEGLEWLSSIHKNGLNGILADEMGLGKTIQTISFLAYLREVKSYGPFLIAAPLSTTSNWLEEFRKWTPTVPVVLYHGSKQDREQLRKRHFKNPGTKDFPVIITSYEICMNDRNFLNKYQWGFLIIDEGHRLKNLDCKLIRELQTYSSANRLLITGTPLQNNLSELWSLLHFLMPEIFANFDQFESWFDFSELKSKQGYESILSESRQKQLVTNLHAILKPFLLRRVKADVEKHLPKKREYILFAPLTPMQRELYQAILDGSSRRYLESKAVERLSMSRSATPMSVSGRSSIGLKRKAAGMSGRSTPAKSVKSSRESTPTGSVRGRRSKRQSYEELSDRKYFAQLQAEDSDDEPEQLSSEAEEEKIWADTLALAKKQIGLKKLQNPIMQLRLCCDSPYNFFNPFLLEGEDGEAGEPDETLVTTSGKMMLLDSLLPTLFNDGHKVLIFSQFKTQLDLLEQYAYLRNWKVCRIDGSIPQTERQAQITSFNTPATGKSKKDAVNLFLLSTRAGGQGINLAAADTVILYDSDWNPQQDLQAQDRAHRIGQVNNVIVYRLATRGTVEQTLLDTAEGKRRLEKLVIRKQRFREDGAAKSKQDKDDIEELQRLLRQSDGESLDLEDKGGRLLSEEDLKILTDRSEAAYVKADEDGAAGKESAMFKNVEKVKENSLLDGFKA
jgi:ATP-dependent DNA helicase